MPDVSIRSYRDGDERGIVDLFHRCFHPHRTVEHWRWKFRDHPHGGGLISVATAAGGDIVAHCGGYPVVLVDARETPGRRPAAGLTWPVRCLHVGDIMADPRARPSGMDGSVFEATFRHLAAQVVSAGIPFMYGVVAEASDRFYERKLRRRLVGPVTYRCCDAVGLAERVRAVRGKNPGFSIRVVDRPAREFDDFFSKVGPSYGVLARRDAEYIDWRYCRCPDRHHKVYSLSFRGRLVGWAVFRRIESRLVWGDAMIDPGCPGAAECLLDVALRDRGAEGVEIVEGWFPARPGWWNLWLQALGFTTMAEPRGLRLVLVCTAKTPEDRHWAPAGALYYTMGDTDLF